MDFMLFVDPKMKEMKNSWGPHHPFSPSLSSTPFSIYKYRKIIEIISLTHSHPHDYHHHLSLDKLAIRSNKKIITK
jgi:hypothetical protein